MQKEIGDMQKIMWRRCADAPAAKPDDYVVATNEMHTVRECIETAFSYLDIPIKWEGEKENEVGIDTKTNQVIVRVDPAYYRPSEVELLIGDYSKAKEVLAGSQKLNSMN